jgi:hypothetical protein
MPNLKRTRQIHFVTVRQWRLSALGQQSTVLPCLILKSAEEAFRIVKMIPTQLSAATPIFFVKIIPQLSVVFVRERLQPRRRQET